MRHVSTRTYKDELCIDRGISIVAQGAFSRVDSRDTGNLDRLGPPILKSFRLETLSGAFAIGVPTRDATRNPGGAPSSGLTTAEHLVSRTGPRSGFIELSRRHVKKRADK